jgi:hypothetical protein
MFAYFSKLNDNNIISYTHNMICLYFNENDGDGSGSNVDDNEYLFNNQTITYWTTNSPPEEIVVRYEDMPPLFSYN